MRERDFYRDILILDAAGDCIPIKSMLGRSAYRAIDNAVAAGMTATSPDFDWMRTRIYSTWQAECPDKAAEAKVRWVGE